MTIRFSTWIDNLVPTVTTLSSNDKLAVVTDAPDTRSVTLGNLASSLFGTVVTTDGDLITRSGGVATRLTRSGLANDSAFTSKYVTVDTLTAKGDLFVRSNSSISRVAVGSNNQVLTADSSQATGVRWAAASDVTKLPLTGGTITGSLTLTGSLALSGALTGTSSTFTQSLSAQNFVPAVSALGTSGTINLDFSGDGFRTQSALTGNVSYTGSSYAVGRSVTIRVINGSTTRNLSFPVNWVFLGIRPLSIAANKTAILTVTSFGTTEADCVAAWAIQS
jgi:hypothetical protein